MSELEVLQQVGLSHAEALVYLALLETGSTLAGAVIKKTGFHRGTTYQVLLRLKEKGLVSSIKKGKKQHFQVVSPERLLDVLKEKQEKLEEILPVLKRKLDYNQNVQEVTVYSGLKGIRSVLDKMLQELTPNGNYYDFGASGLFRTLLGSYFDYWQKKKQKHGIKSYVIFNGEVKREQPDLLKRYHGKARFYPANFVSISDTIIYLDTVVLFIWTAKPPIAILIKNKDNADSYKNQFKLLWKQTEK